MSSWTDRRRKLAESIAYGTAGWLQTKACEGLTGAMSEDAAKFIVAEIINASHRFQAAVSKRPRNWPNKSKHRIDIAIEGRSSENSGDPYGFAELKWPRSSTTNDWVKARLQIVQDAVRVLTANTANLNARFVVLGADEKALAKLFTDKQKKDALEESRNAFASLFPKTAGQQGELLKTQLQTTFPGFASRLPIAADFNKVTATLLSRCDASIGTKKVGSVFVWNIKKRR